MHADGDVDVTLVGAEAVEADVLRPGFHAGEVAARVEGGADEFAFVTVAVHEGDGTAGQRRRGLQLLRVGRPSGRGANRPAEFLRVRTTAPQCPRRLSIVRWRVRAAVTDPDSIPIPLRRNGR